MNAAIKASLNLFAPTFNRLPATNNTVSDLKKSMKGRYDSYTLEIGARVLYLNKLINEQAAELQHTTTLEVLSHFDLNYDSFSFDYEKGIFNLSKVFQKVYERKENKFSYQVGALNIEFFDHPFRRQSLYFHEIKDLDKYVDIEQKPGLPKFWKNVNRKKAENELLDDKNPLGVPHWAKPLVVDIQGHKDQNCHCGFELSMHLGEVKIEKVYHKKENYTHFIDPQDLEEKTQEMIFLFLKKRAGISQEELEAMSKLAFIGGRAKKLEVMMDLLDGLSSGISPS